MKSVLDKIISAVTAVGIKCEREYCRLSGYCRDGSLSAYVGIRKIRFERLREGMSDVTVQARVTVQGFSCGGDKVQEAAEKKILPAVMSCGEEIFGAEISEVKYEPSTDRVYCEIFFDVRRGGHDVCG